MLWEVIVASTRLRPEVDREGRYLDRKGKATGRERMFFALFDQTLTGQQKSVDRYLGRLSLLASASIGLPF